MDLVVTSGGLGPTADDLTLEVVARFAGRELALDEALEQRIADILRPLMKRWRNLDFEAVRAANRKQALVPDGATVIEPAGTAPGHGGAARDGSRADGGDPPGPAAGAARDVARGGGDGCVPRGGRRGERVRAVDAAPVRHPRVGDRRDAAGRRGRRSRASSELEITTCLRRGEVEVVVRHEPAAAAGRGQALEALIADRHGNTLFSTDGSTVDEQVAKLLDGLTVATAESCTGGLMAARLTERPGSSAYVAGGTVAYANEAKTALLGVDPALIEQARRRVARGGRRHGRGRARALRRRTWRSRSPGSPGPDGGTEEKPVGTVCWCAKRADGATLARDVRMPGDRNEVRDRSTTVGMHLLRRLLRGEEFPVPAEAVPGARPAGRGAGRAGRLGEAARDAAVPGRAGRPPTGSGRRCRAAAEGMAAPKFVPARAWSACRGGGRGCSRSTSRTRTGAGPRCTPPSRRRSASPNAAVLAARDAAARAQGRRPEAPAPPRPLEPFEPTALTLYRSHLGGRRGARYEALSAARALIVTAPSRSCCTRVVNTSDPAS